MILTDCFAELTVGQLGYRVSQPYGPATPIRRAARKDVHIKPEGQGPRSHDSPEGPGTGWPPRREARVISRYQARPRRALSAAPWPGRQHGGLDSPGDVAWPPPSVWAWVPP